MGTWGVGVFSDDLAADIRGDWRDALLEGLDDAAATERLMEAHAGSREDPDEEPVFWIALAAAQMETGRLAPGVRDRALEVIASGRDLDRWDEEEPGLRPRREKVLAALADKLTGPQPKPKKLRGPRPLAVAFELGDVIRVRNESAEALLVVVDHAEEPRGIFHPVVEALAWHGGKIPPPRKLERMPTVRTGTSIEPGSGPWPKKRLRPHMIVLMTADRASVFGAHIGEVVAKGIRRSPSADYRRGALEKSAPAVTSYMAWPKILDWLAYEYPRELEAAPRQRFR